MIASTTDRPASARFAEHAAVCGYGADPRRCQVCRDLSRDAAAEDGRRYGWAPDEREWDGWGPRP